METVLSTSAGNERSGTDTGGLKSSYVDGSIRMDLAYDITRTIATIPARRLGDPAEFAAAVAFLCSPAAA